MFWISLPLKKIFLFAKTLKIRGRQKTFLAKTEGGQGGHSPRSRKKKTARAKPFSLGCPRFEICKFRFANSQVVFAFLGASKL